MNRIFGDFAYGSGPRAGCWWDKTCDLPAFPELEGDISADVAIVGGGFTGLNAALTLAEAGANVVVLEAEQPGWGASGRNGGFCCLGGGKASDRFLDRHFGKDARLEWRRAEIAAIDYVAGRIDHHGWDVDRHSQGETLLAHRPMALDAENAALFENYGVEPQHHSLDGFSGTFHGAMTLPLGFALNPRKYLAGLIAALENTNARLFGKSPVRSLRSGAAQTSKGTVRADRLILATNGYSSEDVPDWLGGRYMPAQSNVLVTRPLSRAELDAQGWQSRQMCYDTRNLLHYFRLMPDNRFLFGMRGGLFSGQRAEAGARRALVRDFRRMFPAWADVTYDGSWSGLVAMARGQLPFVGPVPGHSGLFAAMCYHGNGVAMGSYCGHLLARFLTEEDRRPLVLRKALAQFPLGRARRLLMPPLYAGLALADRVGP